MLNPTADIAHPSQLQHSASNLATLTLADIATTDDVDRMLLAGAPVAIGVSGGKDGTAATIATIQYLNRIGHTGPRILVHADLGLVEWKQSLPMCQQLADYLGLELVVVKRPAGGLMERWESRWAANVKRYEQLSTVTLIMPWSSSALKFCTGEQKVQPIASMLRKRFKGQTVLNVTGVRRSESRRRSTATVASVEPSISTKSTTIWSWRPIVDWSVEDDFAAIAAAGLTPHPAYTDWGLTRVSCRFCVLASGPDLMNASRDPDAIPLFRRMVDLEIKSTYGFQGNRWLADIAPHLLTEEQLLAVIESKNRAAQRKKLEATIPKELLYTKGWPTRMPTLEEAKLLAGVRQKMAELIRLQVDCTSAQTVLSRYAELMSIRDSK